MNMEQTKLSKTDIAKVLNDCKIDPKDTLTRYNVAARTDDPDYCMHRAIEELVVQGNKGVQEAIKLLAISEALCRAK